MARPSSSAPPAGSLTPGAPSRGSRTGRPIMVLLDALGRRWSLRILWELRGGARRSFRDLRAACDDISPSVLNDRLKQLRGLALVELGPEGYALTAQGADLGAKLNDLDAWAKDWAKTLPGD
ncbi:MAG: helix-turn-helix domain-containing protein [Pseudomonadota bacterium]|nr:helix-turn-helix domain-containing protein [Pseudomonadota bacterium]